MEIVMQHAGTTRPESLRLFGMAHSTAEPAQQGGPAYQGTPNMFGDPFKSEMAERGVRSVACR